MGRSKSCQLNAWQKCSDVRYKESHLQLNVWKKFWGLHTMKVFVFLMPSMQSSGNATSICNLQMKLKLLKDTEWTRSLCFFAEQEKFKPLNVLADLLNFQLNHEIYYCRALRGQCLLSPPPSFPPQHTHDISKPTLPSPPPNLASFYSTCGKIEGQRGNTPVWRGMRPAQQWFCNMA